MPKPIAEDNAIPSALRPFQWHGLDFTLPRTNTGDEALAECPFCGKENKFSINIHTGEWRCFTCQTGTAKGGGNIFIFLRELHELSKKTTKRQAIEDLTHNRKLLSSTTLIQWGVVQSALTGQWLLPAYNIEGKITHLYRYSKEFGPRSSSRWRIYACPGLHHSLYGANNYDAKKPEVWVCEGPWDAMAAWEVLRVARRTPMGRLVETTNPEVSLFNKINVLAAPSCNVFPEVWLPLFADKIVTLLFDSDYPVTNSKTNYIAPPAGHTGMKRAAGILAGASEPPKEIRYLKWSVDTDNSSGNRDGTKDSNREIGYDHTRPTGYDIRDLLTTLD